MFLSVLTNTKSTNDVRLSHVLMFAKLDTSQIFTPFNPLRSHNVAHNCDRATFKADCCYDIFQHLLRICVSTAASVTTHHQHVEIFYDFPLTNKSPHGCRCDKAVVWRVEVQE